MNLCVTMRSEFWRSVASWGQIRLPGLNPWRIHRLLSLLLTKPNEVFKGRLKEGVWFHGSYRDFDTRMWATDDTWNRVLVQFIAARLKDSPGAFIDVGANLGAVSALVAQSSPESHVLSIEANPATAHLASLTFAANGLSNSELVQVAVGDKPGVLELHSSDFHSGNASLTPRSAKAGSRAISVSVTTLDSLVSERGLDPVSIMKIDVEGFEPEVLAGAMDLIKRDLPMIVIEFNAAVKARGFEFEDLFGPLRALGYTFSWLEAEGGEPILIPELERHPAMKSEDVVCLPPSPGTT